MELPKPIALSVQELNDSVNNTINDNDLASGMLYKNANTDDLSSLTPQSRSKIKKAYPQCMSKAQQKALEDTFASPRASRPRVEKAFLSSIVSFLPGNVSKFDRSPEIIQRAIHMVSVYPVMRVASTAFANALQMTQRTHRRSTFDRLEQSSLRLSRKSISFHDRSDNPVTMDSPGAMAAAAAANANNNNTNNNYNVSNLSMTNTNLSDMSAHLNDSFNCDISMLLDMSWTRLELMEDQTDNVNISNNNNNEEETKGSANTKCVEASDNAENVNNSQNKQVINYETNSPETRQHHLHSQQQQQHQQQHHHHYYHQSSHFALRESVVQIAATLKRAMMWSVIIVNMLAHERMVSEFCALRLRRVLEAHMLPVLLARKEETGSIVPAKLKAAHDDRASFTHGEQRRDAQESLHGHYLKEHSSFLASFNCPVLLETLAEQMERLRYVADEIIVRANSLDQQEMYFLISGKVEISEPVMNQEQKMKQKGLQQQRKHEFLEEEEEEEEYGCNALTPMHGKSRFITPVNNVNSAHNNTIRRPKKTVLLSGSTFGGVFRTNTTYSATYKALTQCIVWKLTAPAFERAFKMYADETMLNTYVDVFRAVNMEYLTSHLSVSAAMPRIPIYRLLDHAVTNYANDFTPVVKVRGEVLFKENDPPGVVYCLIEGAVLRQTAGYDDNNNNNISSGNNTETDYVDDKTIVHDVNASSNIKEHNNNPMNLPTSAHGVSQILTTNNIQASAGRARFVLLGDEAHVLPCLQRYSCTVHSRVALFYCVSGEQFVNALLDHPTLYVALREQLTEQLRSRMKLHPSCLTYCPLFRHLPSSALHSICAAAEPRIVQRGCAICEPVQHVKEIFLIIRGQVRDARLAQRTPDPPLPCASELESFEHTNAIDERHHNNRQNVLENDGSRHRHAEHGYQKTSSPRSQPAHTSSNNKMTNTITHTHATGKSNTNASATNSRHNKNNNKNTLTALSRTNLAASMKSNYINTNTSATTNNFSSSVNGANVTSPPWQHALLDADNADSSYSLGSPFSLSASALINKAFHRSQTNNSPKANRMNNMNTTLKSGNTFTSSHPITQSTKGVASTWNHHNDNSSNNNNKNKKNNISSSNKLNALNGSLTATYNTMQRYSNSTGAVEVVVPADEEELNPPLPRTSTRRFTYTIGGYWIGLLVEKWPYGFESTTTVELFAIPTLKIRNEFNSCAKVIQNAILHDVREAQRVEMGWTAIKVNKLPLMESYQPLHTRSGNQAGSVNSRNTGNARSTSRNNRSTLKYKSTCDEESRPGSSRRLSRSPSMLQRSAISNNNNATNKYNMHDELNVSSIDTQIKKNNRCLSRSDELQSTMNEYDACFTHFADESSKTQTHTRGKAEWRQNELEQPYYQHQQQQEESVENEWNSPNCYNNNNSSNEKNNNSGYHNDSWRSRSSNSSKNRNRTNAMHNTMQTVPRTNVVNSNRDADKQRHVHVTHSTAKFGKEAKAGARITRSVESILAEYKSKSAKSEEYDSVSRDGNSKNNSNNNNNNNINLLSNARTRQALARYNGEPQTASEHIINSVIRDPVILPSVHVHRKPHASNCTNVNWTDTLMSTDPWPRLTHASQQWFSATNSTNALTQTIGPMSDPHSITLLTRLTKSNILAIEDTDAVYRQTLMSETLYFARENEKRKAKQGVAAQNEVVNNCQLSRRGVVQKVELPKRHAILS